MGSTCSLQLLPQEQYSASVQLLRRRRNSLQHEVQVKICDFFLGRALLYEEVEFSKEPHERRLKKTEKIQSGEHRHQLHRIRGQHSGEGKVAHGETEDSIEGDQHLARSQIGVLPSQDDPHQQLREIHAAENVLLGADSPALRLMCVS